MNATKRKRSPLGVALLAAGLCTFTAHAGTIDVRVSPGTRMTKATPASVTPTARWSRNTGGLRPYARQGGSVRFPTVVLGTTNYIQPAPRGVAQRFDSRGSLPNQGVSRDTVYGDMLPMVFGTGAGSDGGNFLAATVNGVSVRGGNLDNSAGAFVTSPFIGVAGPGFGLGVAGPGFGPGVAGPGFGLGVAGPGVGFVDQGVIARSNGTGSGNVNSANVSGGNIVISGSSMSGASTVSSGGTAGAGNMVIGVGGAALSGGRR